MKLADHPVGAGALLLHSGAYVPEAQKVGEAQGCRGLEAEPCDPFQDPGLQANDFNAALICGTSRKLASAWLSSFWWTPPKLAAPTGRSARLFASVGLMTRVKFYQSSESSC